MRAVARWFLASVLVLDVCFAIVVFTGGATTIGAENDPAEPATVAENVGGDPGAFWTREALQVLGQRLEERSVELARREAEIEELMRGEEVLRRGGALEDAASDTRPVTAPAESENVAGVAFQRLQRAYENMEPQSASKAMIKLAARDKEAVVQLLLGWQPRTSGAVLDAMTQTNPTLAADLSYEIWKMDGKKRVASAGSGR